MLLSILACIWCSASSLILVMFNTDYEKYDTAIFQRTEHKT